MDITVIDADTLLVGNMKLPVVSGFNPKYSGCSGFALAGDCDYVFCEDCVLNINHNHPLVPILKEILTENEHGYHCSTDFGRYD